MTIACLWLATYSSSIYNNLSVQHRIPNSYANGDLYRLSHLSAFKEPIPECHFPIVPKAVPNADLYILGDSFTFNSKPNPNAFATDTTVFSHWDSPNLKILDNSKSNIILLECVERAIKPRFGIEDIYLKNSITTLPVPSKKWYDFNSLNLFEKNMKTFEERLVNILFNWDFMLYFRELKAKIDYYFFDRKSKNFVLGKKKDHIFYYDEANPDFGYSSFYSITDVEVTKIAQNFVKTEQYLKENGFDKVIFSIIPNKVTMLEPDFDKHNYLIDRLQPELVKSKLNVLDIYSIFKKTKANYYYKSDTHWNCDGKSIWINEIGKLNCLRLQPED